MDTTTIPVQRQRNEVRLGGSEGGSGEDYRVFVPNGQHILHVGVDLNSFIRDPSFSPKKNLLSPNFRLPAFYLSPKYVVFMCAMYVVFCSRQWLLLYWQTQNTNFTVCQHVSST